MTAQATGDADSAYVGDYTPPLATLEAFINKLVGKGYLQPGEVGKLLTAPSAGCTATDNGTTPPSVTLAGTSAIKFHPVQDSDPANTIFCTSLNYVYGSALAAGTVPYGTKGFIVMHKGGDGAVFKEGQATLAGWGGAGNEVTFQNAVGAKLARLLELSPLVILRSRYDVP